MDLRPPGIAEYSLVDVPTVMGNGIAAQSIAWSDFVLGIDKPGVSPFAGKFVYGPIPIKAGSKERYAEAKPKMPKFYEIYDVMSGVAQEVGLGRISPEEGAKKGQAELLKLCTSCLL